MHLRPSTPTAFNLPQKQRAAKRKPLPASLDCAAAAVAADPCLGMTRDEPHPEMAQAHRDLKKGLLDTDARAKDGRPLGSHRSTH